MDDKRPAKNDGANLPANESPDSPFAGMGKTWSFHYDSRKGGSVAAIPFALVLAAVTFVFVLLFAMIAGLGALTASAFRGSSKPVDGNIDNSMFFRSDPPQRDNSPLDIIDVEATEITDGTENDRGTPK